MFKNKIFAAIKSNSTDRPFAEILLSLGALVSILWAVYFAVVTISIPYQIEFREGAAQVMTGFLLGRNNPFIFENQPLAMNNYGLGYYVIVAPFAALFGNTLFVHRSVTFVFVLLSSLAGFFVIQQTRRNVASALAGAAFIMISLTAQGGIGAFPSAMGTFLFMLAVLIPFLNRFRFTSLLLSALFSIVAFYAKPYFALGFLIVASYLFLFVSKKTGLLYGVLFLTLFVVSFCAMRLVFPLYFINTVIGNIANTTRSFAHLFAQLAKLLAYFFPVLFASLLLLVFEKGILNRGTGRAFNLRAWDQPLFNARPDYFFYAFLCALLAFVFLLGPHIGSYMSYAYQLVMPIFFCWFFLKFDPRKKWGFLIAVLVTFNLFLWQRSVLSLQMLEQRNSKEWASLYSYVKSSANILNSPVITSMLIELGLSPLDSGQTSYFYAVGHYPDNVLFGPDYETFHTDGFKYIRFIDNSIEKQEFDLVFTTVEKGSFYHAKFLDQSYTPVAELAIDMPQVGQQWMVLVWKPLVK